MFVKRTSGSGRSARIFRVLVVVTAVIFSSSDVARADDVEYATDSGDKAYFNVKIYLADENGALVTDSNGSPLFPDPCYSSLYQYDWNYQAQLLGQDIGNWNGYDFTETHQYVITGTESLGEYNYYLNVDLNYDDGRLNGVDQLQISFLGGEGDAFFTSSTVSIDDIANSGKGLYIPWMSIVSTWPQSEPGLYSNSPLHISVVPMTNGAFVSNAALVIFLDANPVLPVDDCSMAGYELCNPPNGFNEPTLCCYLKADQNDVVDGAAYTLPFDWYPTNAGYAYGGLSGAKGGDAYACFQDTQSVIHGPFVYDDPQGYQVWISSLNDLIKSTNTMYEGYSIQVVVDAKTTINFPLSNIYYTSESGDWEVGYDVSQDTANGRAGRVTVTGYGRINGVQGNLLYSQGAPNPERRIASQLMWITGNGFGSSGNGWPAARTTNPEPFTWADNNTNTQNVGDVPEHYGVVVTHVQVGYGPPIGDAPVSLGDFAGGVGDGITAPNQYGAAVLVKDVKFVSFSMQSDGISMRNPASLGSGLFIHGSDDLLKTVTGVPTLVDGWKAQQVTFFAGFGEYGSLTCPCCFGPTSGFQNGPDWASCRNNLVQDVLIPIVYRDNGGYNSPGLLTTRWGADSTDDPNFGGLKSAPNIPITVDLLAFRRYAVLENGFNRLLRPAINWMMNTNPGLQGGIVEYVLASADAVTFEDWLILINQESVNGFLEYNWGIGESAASVSGVGAGGAINAYLAGSRTDPGICATYTSDLVFAVCPTKALGSAATPLDANSAANCAAWYISDTVGGVLDANSVLTWQNACANNGGLNTGDLFGSTVQDGIATAGIFGDNDCDGDGLCGLRFIDS